MLSTLRTENSPFNEQQLKLLQSSISGLTPVQSQWLSGYLAGRLADLEPAALTPQAVPEPANILTIIYATETGNSKAIASGLASEAQQQGFSTRIHSMDNFRPTALRKLRNVAFVISTHGEGDPPDEALEFFEYLENEQTPRFSDLKYRVLALGDRSYEFFCEAGRKLELRLQTLGAQSFGQLVECDVDYAVNAKLFTDEVIQYARENLTVDGLTTDQQFPKIDATVASYLSLVPNESRWSRQSPFTAELRQIQKITGSDSTKDIYHIELSLEDSGLQYQPGDALGVWAPNDTGVTDRILENLQIDASQTVSVNDQDLSVSEALINHLEITRLSNDTILSYANVGHQHELKALYSRLEADQQQLFIKQRQLVDLADEYPAALEAQDLVDILRPLSPRSYSIASSQQVVDEEVHLTVATLHSNAIGIARKGVASGLLNHRLAAGEQLKVFLEPNDRFRLPDNREAPIIMIAAGTGIAPYRAFMQELESVGISPDSWLIFGNPHLRTDFLYQREWLHWRKSGLLKHIDTAWSRDQSRKHYVQDVVREQAVRIDHWLQRGAHIYICGSLQMGQAVQEALRDVLIQQREIEADQATQVLAELRRERRIKKDLY